MANGDKGDHPLTDILYQKLEVYGPEADGLIRNISELCSRCELGQWWESEIGWSRNADFVITKARRRLEELLSRAKESGWEAN